MKGKPTTPPTAKGSTSTMKAKQPTPTRRQGSAPSSTKKLPSTPTTTSRRTRTSATPEGQPSRRPQQSQQPRRGQGSGSIPDDRVEPQREALKYSVVVQKTEGLSEALLKDYFEKGWGAVVSVEKKSSNKNGAVMDQAYVTFKSAQSVEALLALDKRHPIMVEETHTQPSTGAGSNGTATKVVMKDRVITVLPHLLPQSEYWAKEALRKEAALAQLEDPDTVTPANLRFIESKRKRSVLRPGQEVILFVLLS